MNIVCNSSPLIFLSKIDRLKDLFELFDKVYIPKAVYNEILLSGKNDICAKEVIEGISSGNIIQFNVQNQLVVKALSGRLHTGEVEVMVGAMELDIKDVILDDLSARRKAKQLNLNVTVTLGILIVAFTEGLFDNLESEIQKLLETDFRISSALLKKIMDDSL
jgi:uncharacterized protein